MLSKVIFMTVMVATGDVSTSSSSSKTISMPAPVVAKETLLIESGSAMQTCRQLEAAFHNGYKTTKGVVTHSVETYYTTDADTLTAKVIRESSCTQVK